MKCKIDVSTYYILCDAGQMAVSQPLVSPTANTVMSPTPNTVVSSVNPRPTPTISVPAISKVTPLQTGLSNPSGASSPALTTEHVQQLPLASSHISYAQQMVPGQHVGIHMSQHHQGLPLMGNFVPGVPEQMPMNLAMMQPPPGAQVPTCQVAVQPQMMPVSSMAHHQHPMVSGIGQMPVIVSVQPGIDGLHHGMPHFPEHLSQMAGGASLVQMHPIPMTTLPMPPPLQPITCSDLSLPPPLQPLSVMSPMVQMPAHVPVPVRIPPLNSGSLSSHNKQMTPQTQPQSPIYEVKLDTTTVKDMIIEKADPGTTTASPDKSKAESKCDGVKVENGDDDTIIAENVTVMTETEDQNSESSKPPVSDTEKDSKCSSAGGIIEPVQPNNTSLQSQSNGES